MLLDKSGQVREVFAKTTELWVWDKRCSELKDGQLVSYAENYFEVKMAGPHSVTQNPKVRSIEYTVNFEIYGNPEEYLKLQKFAEKYRRTNNVSFATSQNMIAYWLYELNERRSKELAEFYNPLDNVQQDKFNQLVKDFLSEPLRDSGIRYKYAEFSIPGT
ncbi:MAG: hypothetical protein NTZ97_01690 [Candidatus Moranbacteria bacterium]|nr:hypothetical protein [Candidatus Moranbacteria bacterium]